MGGHWKKHELAKGQVRYESKKIFGYFNSNKKMKKSFNKEMFFNRDEFDTMMKLYFDVLWVLRSKNKRGKMLYYLHFHEIKSGKPNFYQLERQLKYVYPRSFMEGKEYNQFMEQWKTPPFKKITSDFDMPTAIAQYYYLWIPLEHHKKVESHIISLGLESMINRNIRILDFDILDKL